MKEQKLQDAYKLFDTANEQDPNTELYNGKAYPKELLYAQRMTSQLNKFEPEASIALKLAARSQHICRWQIPRGNYEMNKVGYLKWRQELKNFHAEKASSILMQLDFDKETIENVQFLLLKKQLKKNAETQVLEDVICLVFLEFYFEAFAKEKNEEKLIGILQKTWRKMSEKGQKAALELPLSDIGKALIKKALTE